MVKKLKRFEFDARGLKIRYHWDVWLDGDIRLIERKKDYYCSDVSFRNVVYTNAKKRGIRVRTTQADGGLVIQAILPD